MHAVTVVEQNNSAAKKEIVVIRRWRRKFLQHDRWQRMTVTPVARRQYVPPSQDYTARPGIPKPAVVPVFIVISHHGSAVIIIEAIMALVVAVPSSVPAIIPMFPVVASSVIVATPSFVPVPAVVVMPVTGVGVRPCSQCTGPQCNTRANQQNQKEL